MEKVVKVGDVQVRWGTSYGASILMPFVKLRATDLLQFCI